jgi:ubiquinone/menaquinone biosynthesis C-methylase UbiE
MSNARIYDAVLREVSNHLPPDAECDYLDIGSGRGELIREMQQRYRCRVRACDYTDELMKADQRVDLVNLNEQPLPYPDHSFDVVTASEVIEHLECYREVLREIYRVLRPGGIVVLTTPNVLNIKSRIRYLTWGFANLFGPLPVKNDALYSTGGHINPVGYFYVAHALADAGFVTITPSTDKFQRSGFLWYALLWLPIKFMEWKSLRSERHKFKTVTKENEAFLEALNSKEILLGRTLVVTAQR